jgi:hypothetical protein
MLPQGRLLMLPRAGHAPFLSHPRAVLEALLAPGDIPGGATVAAPTVSSSAAGS